MLRVAVYPGTFDPITNGHLDILLRATAVFDRVIIAVAQNNYKNNLFTLEERLNLVTEEIRDLANVEAKTFSGLLIDFVISNGASAIVRGLRAVSDFEYELQLALMNKKMAPNVETVFFMTASQYSFLSSNIIKQVALLDGCIKGLVPKSVEKALKQKFEDQNKKFSQNGIGGKE